VGLRIATNAQSLTAQRHLGVNGQAQRDTLERLASGSRINKAADDAAGLAISEKMKGQIRSIRQSVRNANDGISMIQTAEGGVSEIGNILTRFRELSIQAASDTIGDVERSFIDKEVQAMKQEITRISSSIEFNGRKLLTSDGGELEIQVGLNNDPLVDRFKFDTKTINASLEGLGLGDISGSTKENARESLGSIDKAVNLLVSNRAELGALQSRLQSAVNSLNIYDENLSSANSRIRDMDMAVETAELAKNNILTSAGVSVLSQANVNSMMALKLIS
jgi:flagellin